MRQKHAKPLSIGRLTETLRETVCTLILGKHMSGYYYTMIYQMPKIVNGIYKVLVPRCHANVVGNHNRGSIVHTNHCGKQNPET